MVPALMHLCFPFLANCHLAGRHGLFCRLHSVQYTLVLTLQYYCQWVQYCSLTTKHQAVQYSTKRWRKVAPPQPRHQPDSLRNAPEQSRGRREVRMDARKLCISRRHSIARDNALAPFSSPTRQRCSTVSCCSVISLFSRFANSR
jgi:hypothetical protein